MKMLRQQIIGRRSAGGSESARHTAPVPPAVGRRGPRSDRRPLDCWRDLLVGLPLHTSSLLVFANAAEEGISRYPAIFGSDLKRDDRAGVVGGEQPDRRVEAVGKEATSRMLRHFIRRDDDPCTLDGAGTGECP